MKKELSKLGNRDIEKLEKEGTKKIGGFDYEAWRIAGTRTIFLRCPYGVVFRGTEQPYHRLDIQALLEGKIIALDVDYSQWDGTTAIQARKKISMSFAIAPKLVTTNFDIFILNCMLPLGLEAEVVRLGEEESKQQDRDVKAAADGKYAVPEVEMDKILKLLISHYRRKVKSLNTSISRSEITPYIDGIIKFIHTVVRMYKPFNITWVDFCLYQAVRRKKWSFARIFLEFGANMNAYAKDEMTIRDIVHDMLPNLDSREDLVFLNELLKDEAKREEYFALFSFWWELKRIAALSGQLYDISRGWSSNSFGLNDEQIRLLRACSVPMPVISGALSSENIKAIMMWARLICGPEIKPAEANDHDEREYKQLNRYEAAKLHLSLGAHPCFVPRASTDSVFSQALKYKYFKIADLCLQHVIDKELLSLLGLPEINPVNDRVVALGDCCENNLLTLLRLLFQPSLKDSRVYDAKSKGTKTLLFIAAEKGHAEIVQFLLLNNANVNLNCMIMESGQMSPIYGYASGHRRMTTYALHIAASNGFPECVRLLLDYGANRNVMDSNGCLAIDLARKHNYDDIVKLLESEE